MGPEVKHGWARDKQASKQAKSKYSRWIISLLLRSEPKAARGRDLLENPSLLGRLFGWMQIARGWVVRLLSLVEELLPPVLREDLLEHPALPSLLRWLLGWMKVFGPVGKGGWREGKGRWERGG